MVEKLADGGINEDVGESALELDAILQRWRRRIMKRELGHRAIADLDLALDLAQLDALTAIWAPANEFGGEPDDEIMVSTVAARLAIDPSRASRLTTELIRLGLVRRAVSQFDARRTILEVTTEGDRIVSAVRQYKFLVLGNYLKGWTAEEIATFIPLLERFSTWSETLEDTSPLAKEIARLREDLPEKSDKAG
ncbi:winged helix-turn-helix transcriptional regulator [Pelagovum pacificum]|uniref:Winged helix-turn-helix transcriptional regulator n=2 Tax=Pelagovum pacificum TaxID=2588711 RepID=A0A5C5G8H6_9RHOB|nr:winged helix-turn-helix transcriptional regulator [Pelagovum pacificum]TNY31073.1 winged helix-turn-helix transcriptional regulator [Pelagovum pacificum]